MSSLPADPIALALETAGSACSVAIARGEQVLAAERRAMRHGHAEVLLAMVDAVVARAGLTPEMLDTVAVSVGPGGFTGIRVGLAAARGIALASGARLVGVTCFAAVAAACPPEEAALLVALDSRRSDFYVQLFGKHKAALTQPAAVQPEDLAARIASVVGEEPLTIAGDASEAAAAALAGRHAVKIMPDTAPDARAVIAAYRHTAAPSPAVPLYLRPPDVSFPKLGAALTRMP